ncbi:MAG: hypothetical protein CAF45_002840 [Nitrospira sp. CG24E]|nr:MAG: hypothetical protein CAF45_002840 [Nitrospira sp. CG24E]
MNKRSFSSNRLREVFCFKLVAVFLLLALCTVTIVPAAWSQDNAPSAVESSEGGTTSDAGWGVLAGLSSLVYFPVKAAFAIGGAIVGGLTYAFSGGDEKAAKPVWQTSMYGTYLITPDHLQGNRPVRFLGVVDSNEASAPAPEPIR